jgi:hypothetical protein
MGGVSDSAVRHAHCPVSVVRKADDPDHLEDPRDLGDPARSSKPALGQIPIKSALPTSLCARGVGLEDPTSEKVF